MYIFADKYQILGAQEMIRSKLRSTIVRYLSSERTTTERHVNDVFTAITLIFTSTPETDTLRTLLVKIPWAAASIAKFKDLFTDFYLTTPQYVVELTRYNLSVIEDHQQQASSIEKYECFECKDVLYYHDDGKTRGACRYCEDLDATIEWRSTLLKTTFERFKE
jgi:hypothetical protein